MAKRKQFLNKIISIILIQTFLLSNLPVGRQVSAFAAPQENPSKLISQDEIIQNPDKVVIPREFGLVKSKYIGKNGKLLIHIQDAHCNFEAQSNIVHILENLIKNYNIGFVSVEGADGIIDTSWFKAFPDEEVRKEVASYFMKKGEITGPEFLSITTDLPIKLFGAETRSYYIENLNAFTSSYPLKEETEKYYTQIKTVLNRLKNYIYTEELKALDGKIQDYESKKLPFNEYVRFLEGLAEKHRINLREYSDFFKLISALIYEKKIDFNVTDKERSALIDELSKSMPKEALTELVTKSLSFKSGRISSAEYYDYLKNLSLKSGIEISKKYPNLSNYIVYNSVYSKIENEKLFNDIKNLELAIKERLFKNDDQRTLDKLSRHADILLGLVNIKLLNGDFEYYKTHKEEFTHESFADFIKKKTVQFGLAYEIDLPSDAVQNSIPKLEDFYSIAIKRDKALVDNTLNEIKKEKLQAAVLITGGFHSEGITKLLERQGISYLVVSPNITKDVPSPYIQILTNQRTPFEELLVGSGEAKQGMVAAWIISQLFTLADKDYAAFVNISRAISPVNGKDLITRLKALSNEAKELGALLEEADKKFGAPKEPLQLTPPDAYLKEIYARFVVMHAIKNLKGLDLGYEQIKKDLIKELKTTKRAWLIDEVERLLNLVRREFEKEKSKTRSPGTEAVRNVHFGKELDGDEAEAINNVIRDTIKAGKLIREVFEHRTGGAFVLLDDEYYKNMAEEYGAPADIECHPGTRGTRVNYDPHKPESYSKVKRYYYIKESIFRSLFSDEKLVFAMHEELHIKVALGIVQVPPGINEEEFINNQPGCDVRPVMARLGSIAHMKDILLYDTRYGDSVIHEIRRLEKEGRKTELEAFIKTVYIRRVNIDHMKNVLTEEPYLGYDVIIVSSSTPEEADYQKKILQEAFKGIPVKIYSEVVSEDGGQVLGQVIAVKRAIEEARKDGVDLKKLMEDGKVKVGIFHNGGKGERASPVTQSLGNSRGAQKLVGTILNAQNKSMDAELLLAVVLNSSAFAKTNDGKRVDTFWTSQLDFGTVDFASIPRTNAPYDKLIVEMKKKENGEPDATAKQLYEFGTCSITRDGYVDTFFGNRKKGAAPEQFVIDKNTDAYKTLTQADRAGFDFGSFSMHNDMLFALLNYWENSKTDPIGRYEKGEKLDKKKDSRDIDPQFTQPMAALLKGIAKDQSILIGLPQAEELRAAAKNRRWEIIQAAVVKLKEALPKETLAKLQPVGETVANETIELFLLNRDNQNLFKDLTKTLGTISLGADNEWTTYRRAIDMANEKLLMLSDIIGINLEIDNKGRDVTSPADIQDKIRAEDARRMRRIKNDAVAVFKVGDNEITLTAEQVRTGWEGYDVKIKGSIIQGDCELLPGSVVIDSVINDSQGQVIAENSYIESSTAAEIIAKNSIVFKAIDNKQIKAHSEIVTDAYRSQIKDARFQIGHTRMRAPIGYDPKPTKEVLDIMPVKMADDIKFGDNIYSFQEVRDDMPCNRRNNDRIENKARLESLIFNRLRGGLDNHLSYMASSGYLTNQLVENLIDDFNKSETKSRTRTEMIFFCNLLKKYGDDAVKRIADIEKRDLLAGNLGPTVDPDIYRRDSVRGNANLQLQDPVIRAAGLAYVKTLAKLLKKEESQILPIGVGRESRESGERILKAFIEGCLAAGDCRVIDATGGGKTLTSTPLMYFVSRYRDILDGIVEVTASHLPPEQNGLKPTAGVNNFTADEMKIWLETTHDVIDSGMPSYSPDLFGTVAFYSEEDFIEPYHILLASALEGSSEWRGYVDKVWKNEMTLENAIKLIEPQVKTYEEKRPLEGLRLAADSGFGSMGPIIGPFLRKLGAQLEDIGETPDYKLAHKDANPNNPDNLNDLRKKVTEMNAILGIGFDVDGDRLGVVTYDGKILRGDDISCIIAPVVIKEAVEKANKEGIPNYKPVIVLNVLCSDRLKQVIKNAGGIPVECAVGFNKVKESMTTKLHELYKSQYPDGADLIKGQTAEMGIEISSHIMLKENFNSDDAFFAVIKLLGIIKDEMDELKKAGKAVPNDILDRMLGNLITDYHTGEWRTPIVTNEARIEVAKRLREHYEKMAEENPDKYKIRNTVDGIKIDFFRDGATIGWLAIRPSGTAAEIVIVINSLVSKEAFNVIKNDYFAQLARFKDYIVWEKVNSKTSKILPALEPELYYNQAKAYIFKGETLPVGAEFKKVTPISRTPGTGAVRRGVVSTPEEEQAKKDLADRIAAQNEFVANILHETSLLPEDIEKNQEAQKNLKGYIARYFEKEKLGEPALNDIYEAVLKRLREVRLKTRIPLQKKTVEELDSMKGVEKVSVNQKTGQLEFSNPELAKAYKDRGWHDLEYVVNRLYKGTVDVGKWAHNVTYSMTHFGDLHSATTFGAYPLIPTTPIYQSTGSHSQGLSLDIKLMKTQGIQQIPIFNEKGELVKYRYMLLKPGDWAFSIPGSIDIFTIQQGGNQFADRSITITDENTIKYIANLLGINIETLKNAKLAENLPAKGMPYIFYRNENGAPYVTANPIYTETVKEAPQAIKPFVPVINGRSLNEYADLIFNPARTAEYETSEAKRLIESPEFAINIVNHIMGKEAEIVKEPAIRFTTQEEFNATMGKAKEAFIILESNIREGKAIKQTLLFKTGKEGYTWGQPVVTNFILELMGAKTEEAKIALAKQFGIPENEVIGERWLGAGAIDVGTGYYLPVEALSLWPDEVYGLEHIEEFGSENRIAAKLLVSARPLSLQIHEFPEMIIPLEDGYTYMAVSKNITKEEFIDALKKGDETIVNRIEVKKGEPLIVPAGMPHAYGEVKVYEVKAVNAAQDKAGTISFYDRLGKAGTPEELINQGLVRQGKDILTMPEARVKEIAQKIESYGYLNKTDLSKFQFKPILASPPEKKAEAKFELMGYAEGVIAGRYTIEPNKSIEADLLTQGREHTLFVSEGRVEVVNEEGEYIGEAKKGEEIKIVANARGYTIRSLEREAPSVVFTQYMPLRGEGIVFSAFQAMMKFLAEMKEGKLQSKKFNVWAPQKLYRNNDFIEEKKLLNALTSGNVTLRQYGLMSDLKDNQGFNPDADVVIAAEDDLKTAQKDAEPLKDVLRARMLALPKANMDKIVATGKSLTYAREVEATGVILGNTDTEDIKKKTSQAIDLAHIISQMTGRIVTMNDLETLLAAAKDMAIDSILGRLKRILEQLLLTMPIERAEFDKGIEGRKQALWSV